jgi:hypothetical protein
MTMPMAPQEARTWKAVLWVRIMRVEKEFFTGGKGGNGEVFGFGFCEIGDLMGWNEEDLFYRRKQRKRRKR